MNGEGPARSEKPLPPTNGATVDVGVRVGVGPICVTTTCVLLVSLLSTTRLAGSISKLLKMVPLDAITLKWTVNEVEPPGARGGTGQLRLIFKAEHEPRDSTVVPGGSSPITSVDGEAAAPEFPTNIE